jgi:adenosylmethionine-8-amino-7-oxononanoate aminotransferase
LQQLAGMISDMTPEGIKWVSFVSGGSEATETAMKMSREYFIEKGKPTKYKIISRWQSYHGNTLGALSMSGNIGRRRRYAPLLADFPHVAPPYCYRCPLGKKPEFCNLECAQEIENAIIKEGPENVAAVILEPISGSSIGSVVPKDGYMQAVREICTKYDVLFIADEVMTGIGRTGKNFAVDYWNVVPDMICMAKGLSGGYAPLGAVAVQDFIHETFKNGSGKFTHGFTYGGNPVAAAAGMAVVSYVRENNLVENSYKVGQYLLGRLNELKDKYWFIGDVRGLGLMTGVEFVKDKVTKEPFEQAKGITDKVVNTALKTGLMLYGAPLCADGTKGDAIMIAPPLTITEQEIDIIIVAFEEILTNIFVNIEG